MAFMLGCPALSHLARHRLGSTDTSITAAILLFWGARNHGGAIGFCVRVTAIGALCTCIPQLAMQNWSHLWLYGASPFASDAVSNAEGTPVAEQLFSALVFGDGLEKMRFSALLAEERL